MVNPVLRFELLRASRRDLTFGVRVVYGLVLLLAMAGAYLAWDLESARRTTLNPARFAEATFFRFAILQDLAIVVFVPALVAGAIAEEASKKTLASLLATRLTAFEIVVGKLAVRLLHVGAFVLVGLPVMVPLSLVGGLGLESIISVYAGALGLTILTAGLSILLSTLLARPRAAIGAAYALLAAWLIVPLWLRPSPGAPFLWVHTVADALVRSGPVWTWAVRGYLSDLTIRDPALLAWFRVIFFWSDWPWRAGLHAALGIVFLGLAIAALRRWQDDAPGTIWRRWTGRTRRAPTRPPCGIAPMIWKERYTGQGGAWLRWVGWAIGAVLIVALAKDVFSILVYARQVRARFGVFQIISYNLGEELRPVHASLFVVWMLAVACAAAFGITAEREGATWDALRLSSLRGREIVLAKQLGAFWSVHLLCGMLLVLWILGVTLGALHPLGVVAAGLGLVVFTWFAAALGTAVSLRARTSTQALVLTVAVLLMSNLGYLIPLLALWPASAQSPLSLVGMTPYLEWAVLIPSWAFEPWYRNASPPQFGPLIAYTGGGVVPAYALGLILHSAAALMLTAFAGRAVDADACPVRDPSLGPDAGSPRRSPGSG